MVIMQEFRGKRTMGHAFRRCSFKTKIKVKKKRIGKKKLQFSGLLFLSIPEAGSFAYILTLTTVYLRSKIYDVDIPMYTQFTKSHF